MAITQPPSGQPAPRFLWVVGPRQSGLSSALSACHHYGWATMGNLLPEQLPGILADCAQRNQSLAFTVQNPDINLFNALQGDYASLQGLFLEAPLNVLALRATLSDVPHPGCVASQLTAEQALQAELATLLPFKKVCEFSLNTGEMSPDVLRYKMGQILGYAQAKPPGLSVGLWSFGYKYGIPAEANWVLDVRFIPNPFYIPELRPQTGLDEPIQSYVLSHPVAQQFVTGTAGLIKAAVPFYPQQGIDKLVVAIGCTGGKHRSVTLVETLHQQLAGQLPADVSLTVLHREQAHWGTSRPAMTAIG
jgi:RNase adapter protein RapZ